MNHQFQYDQIAVHGDGDDDNSAYFNSFPPGFRFCPTDEELIVHYLKKRIMNQPLPINRIREVDLYRHNPDDLAEMYQSYKEEEWYFFTPRDRKYKQGNRPSRTARNGYWKATTANKSIESNGEVVGHKKLLNFFIGKAPKGDKSNWIMHEFRVIQCSTHQTNRGPNDMKLDDWVLCRIYKKHDKSTREVQNTEIQVEGVDTLIGDGDYSDVIDEDFGPTHNDPNNSISPSGEDESNDHSLQYNLSPLPSESYFSSNYLYMSDISFDYEDPSSSSNINFDNGDPNSLSNICFDYEDLSISVDDYMLPQYNYLDPLHINYLLPDNILPNGAGNVTNPTDEIFPDQTTANVNNNKRHKSK
ncbi:NAC domain-containing protein 1-like [Macadamia integrifolia]|uniref:NAC domain-containing protein 1-like n=1 Tax=Macadamia integrifolia TaxID=60698 RepID=UPI001C4F5F7F|nr:NAC domain-containing protein 1-like [Macadamia integrifolia]